MKILAAIFFFAVNLSGVAEISLKSKKWVQCLAFSPDGQRVVAGNDEGRLWVVDASSSPASALALVSANALFSASTYASLALGENARALFSKHLGFRRAHGHSASGINVRLNELAADSKVCIGRLLRATIH